MAEREEGKVSLDEDTFQSLENDFQEIIKELMNDNTLEKLVVYLHKLNQFLFCCRLMP